jgi:hypothetical protein
MKLVLFEKNYSLLLNILGLSLITAIETELFCLLLIADVYFPFYEET